jgi:hypothetical protein
MAKVVLNIPYGDYVIDSKDAMALCEALAKAERYREKYSNSSSTHHIYPLEGGGNFGFRLITDEQYKLYRLAGKPEDN